MKTLKPATTVFSFLLLANLAVEGARLIQPAHAATKGHYMIVQYTESNREELLNKYADEGWELSAIDTKFGGFILERQ